MEQSSEFHVGQKVKIGSHVESEYAGYHGMVLFVAKNMCDVKVLHKRQGSLQMYIDAFPKADLYPLN